MKVVDFSIACVVLSLALIFGVFLTKAISPDSPTEEEREQRSQETKERNSKYVLKKAHRPTHWQQSQWDILDTYLKKIDRLETEVELLKQKVNHEETDRKN